MVPNKDRIHKQKSLSHEDYTIAWICALPEERTAAQAMLDEEHDQLPKPRNDHNAYNLGSIAGYNIVIAYLPTTGTNAAATVAANMTHTFQSIKFGLMVGTGSGLPFKVSLGDVVVSHPVLQYPGVVQWDMGKLERGGRTVQTGPLNRPPNILLNASNRLKSDYEIFGSSINKYLGDLEKSFPHLVPQYTSPEEPQERKEVRVYHGLIASGNRVVKDAQARDALDKCFAGHVLCIEAGGAAGVMNDLPCIVIRGICDYADRESTGDWQPYAATVAAVYAKELLGNLQADVTHARGPVSEALEKVQAGRT
ncbi:purine and uridine phosphorylase [Aspergillus heteromorphus CBS 117.55]|uniref:Purine and uridine phosphorylase n=1 Tax=Aspergillus heteromorphus CBS 117.55 TaxID=1448321 RepID=A0A317UQH2_9EURO|nr:purine and uridine phosphorylase [Aspergillus heteromorphus CBS 117.55]PWY64253.1 purine and uridine phosphorylase [Aspergillus heteromorphus CBS 117.55]